MGTIVSVSVPAGEVQHLTATAETAKVLLEALEAELSTYRDTSAIARLNRGEGRVEVALSPAGSDAVDLALTMGRLSEGAFDPTVKPLMGLWGFRGGEAHVPEAAVLSNTLSCVDFEQVNLTRNAEGGVLSVSRPGVALDLGGVAKGVAVDHLFEALSGGGTSNLLINLAGNMRACGRPREGRRGWNIGVRDPFDREGVVGVIELSDGLALATSGNYERFVIIDGKRYAHIVDPRTGWPVEGMAGVTVVAPTAGMADALSTALFVMGVERGLELLQRCEGAEALFVKDAQPVELWMTPGFAERFQPLHAWQDAARVLAPLSSGGGE